MHAAVAFFTPGAKLSGFNKDLLPTDAENISCMAPSRSLLPLVVATELRLLQERLTPPWEAGAALAGPPPGDVHERVQLEAQRKPGAIRSCHVFTFARLLRPPSRHGPRKGRLCFPNI